MADTLVVHHPDRPDSAIRVTAKDFLVNLKPEGFVEQGGVSISTRDVWPVAPQPNGLQVIDRGDVSGTMPADYSLRLQALEERETALAMREVEVAQREAELGLQDEAERMQVQVDAGNGPRLDVPETAQLTARGTPRKRAARRPRTPAPVADPIAQEDVTDGDQPQQ